MRARQLHAKFTACQAVRLISTFADDESIIIIYHIMRCSGSPCARLTSPGVPPSLPFSSPLQHPARYRRRACRQQQLRTAESQQGSTTASESDDELADQMADFLRQQAEKESGGRLAVVEEQPKEVVGETAVSDADAKRYCRDVMSAVKQLRKSRDMSINEVKLTLAIEDPTSREKREYLGIEEDSGVSRDEIAAALLEVTAGRIPLDRLALRELHREVMAWPFLEATDELQAEQDADANYEGITDTGIKKRMSGPGWRSSQARPPIGRDKSETPQTLTDRLPDWVGYGFLYFVSIIPVLIVIATIAVLFFSSLS